MEMATEEEEVGQRIKRLTLQEMVAQELTD